METKDIIFIEKQAQKNPENREPEDQSHSYFGGILKLKTPIIWSYAIIGSVLHVLTLYGLYIAIVKCLQLQFLTIFYSYILAFGCLLGASVGSHRYWSHRTFKATMPLQIFLMALQTMSGQSTIHKWVLRHKVHHKYSDTDADPHNSQRGLIFSHMGWMVLRRHPLCQEKLEQFDMTAYDNDKVVQFQRRHYPFLFLIMGVVPVAVPVALWNESLVDSFLICFVVRLILAMHATFTINSIAHLYGNKPYDSGIGATENVLSSIVTYGEGWHNFHHAFPIDYKNSEFGKMFNFSATFIEWCEYLGLAYDLKQVTPQMVGNAMKKRGDG